MVTIVSVLLVGTVICLLSTDTAHAVAYDSNGCPMMNACDKSMSILGDSCYEFVTKSSYFKDATKHCHDKAGTLVTIKSDAVQQFVLKNLKALKKTSGSVWIGLDDSNTEGTFVWQDGAPIGKFSKLSRAHEVFPFFSSLYRDCVAIDVATGKWFTVNCIYSIATLFDASKYPYVCEYSNRVSHIPTTTLPTTTRCPRIDCSLACFQHGYVVDSATGCNTCQCITIPTTTTTTTTPKPTLCPRLNCGISCARYGYKKDPVTNCSLCECNLN